MSNSGKGSETHPRRPCGLSMLGVLIVAVLLLVVFVFCTWSYLGRSRVSRVVATRCMRDSISLALAAYHCEFGCYPPPTGWVKLDGMTRPFGLGETAEADSLHRYLCSPLSHPVTGRIVEPFLPAAPRFSVPANPPSGPTRIVVDLFGHPFRYDIVQDEKGNLRPRVWSIGPDGKEGPVPFSRAQDRSHPYDEDNIASGWVPKPLP